MRLRLPLAAAAGLILGALLPGCSGCSGKPAPPGNGTPGAGTPGPAATTPKVDPAVVAAREKRTDLARNRVVVLGMDGADPYVIHRLVREGRLPHFRKLMDEGAFGPLRSQQPMLSPLLWTTIATGKYLTEHGVLDFLIRDPDDPGKRIPVTSDMRRTETMWDIAGRYGETVGLVGWLASHPAERVNGFAISEMNEPLAYLFNRKLSPSPEGKSWPPDLVDEYQALRRRPVDIPFSEIDPFLEITEERFRTACEGDEFKEEKRVNNLRVLYCATDNFRRVGEKYYRERRPDLFCTYFEAIDAASHFFMAFQEPVTWEHRSVDEICRLEPKADRDLVEKIVARARGEGDGELLVLKGEDPAVVQSVVELARGARPEQVAMFGGTLDAVYEFHDRILGEYMDLMDPDTVLLVVSDHGFASSPPREVVEAVAAAHGPLDDPRKPPFDSNFNSVRGGAQYHHLSGVLGVYGKGVRKGFRIPAFDEERRVGARLLDIAPTVLALMGFPKAEDMPGRVLTELFELDLAVGGIPSYESDRAARLARERIAARERRRAAGGGRESAEEQELDDAMRELAAIGYVGTAEDAPVRAMLHMATSYMEQGRLEEAEEAFREALKAADGNRRPQILVQIGNLRRDAGDDAEAERLFGRALEEDPAFVPALVGMARIHEDRRETEKAVALWERATEAAPDRPAIRTRFADALRSLAALEAARGGGTTPGSEARLRRALEVIDDTVRIAAAQRREVTVGIPDGPGTEPGGPVQVETVTGDGPGGDTRGLGPAWHNTRGMILVDLGRFDEAMAEFRTAAEMNPDYVRPRNNMGVVSMRRAALAADRLRQAKDPEAQAKLFREMTAHREEALGWFEKVLALEPKNAKARYNRAEIFLHFPPQSLENAEKELELAVEADPKYRRAVSLLEKVRELRAGSAGPR